MSSSALPEAVRKLLALPDGERRIGTFRLERQLGRGGFAPVWLAEEMAGTTKLRLSAVKLFALDAGGDFARQAIIDEAARLCRVEHPNVVRFYQLPFDETRGVIGLAMEYVAGETLGERLRDKETLSIKETLDVGIAVASALSAVHGAGLVHRDLSPANVVVDVAQIGSPAAYKIIDFGISAAQPQRDSPTLANQKRPKDSDPKFRSPLEAIGGKRGYVDPECWRDLAPATSASDLYSLGAMLFICLSGRIPAAGEGSLDADVLHGRKKSPRVSLLARDVPAAIVDLIADLLEPNPENRPRSAEVVALELERVRSALTGRQRALPSESDGPFRGLERFEMAHRDVFFGRRVEVAGALEVLRMRGLVALLGPSGSGKSSMARAGILPAIADGALGGPTLWETVVVSPGMDPRQIVTTALFHIGVAQDWSPDQAAARIEAWLSENRRGLVLLVDQLEEIATLAQGSSGASQTWTLDFLARLGERPFPGLRVVVTARRDLLDPILAHEALGRVLTRGAVLVSPLGSAAWGEVIDAALESYGYSFETPKLRIELLEALETTAGSMPLVEFALRELWQARDREQKKITVAGLRTLEGFAGALSKHANDTFDRAVRGAGTDRVVERVLLALTTPAGARMTRPTNELVKEIGPAAKIVIQVFADARLLLREVERRKDGEVELVTLAHEALLVHWERLRAWVAAEREVRVILEDFEKAAKLWHENPDPETLWRRRRLLLLEEILKQRAMRLEGHAKRFYQTSRAASLRNRIISTVVLVLVVVAGIVAWTIYVDLEAKRAIAEAEKADADAHVAIVEAREAKAQAEAERAKGLQQAAETREAETKAALTALKFVKRALESPGALAEGPTKPNSLDPSVVRQIDEYLLQRERESVPLPPQLEEILREVDNVPNGAIASNTPTESAGAVDVPSTANSGVPATAMVRGQAYAKLNDAKGIAAACGRKDDPTAPKGSGKVALVIDGSGQVSSVALDARFVGTSVGACVDRAFRQISVQPFKDKPVTVLWSFTVQ
jgi:serine/threonine protein kinase